MSGLERGFQDDLREAVLNDVEQRARKEIAPELKQQANALLAEYGQRHNYDVGTLVEAAETEVRRDDQRVEVVLRYPEPALLFERGTVDHAVETTDADADALSFIWQDPPQWVREEFDREANGWRVFLPAVQVSGLPEAGFIRDALNEMRRRLES